MRVIIEPDYDRMSLWAARYIARILSAGLPSADMLSSGPEAASPTDYRAESARGAGGLTLEFLQKNGF